MLVYRMEDLKSIKENIAEELKNNPRFESVFDGGVSQGVYEIKNEVKHTARQGIDVSVSENGKKIQIREPMEHPNIPYDSVPLSKLHGIDINLCDDGSMEVINAFGELRDGQEYIRKINTKMIGNPISILDAYYVYSRFDQNGIETATGKLFERVCKLTSRYNDEASFVQNLYSNLHMPTKWNERGIPDKFPQHMSNYTNVEGVYRDPKHSGIVETYKADLETHIGTDFPTRKNVEGGLGCISSEHPERLVVKEVFAKKTLMTEPYLPIDKYKEMTCDELKNMAEKRYLQEVEDRIQSPVYSTHEITLDALKETIKRERENIEI